MDLERDTTRPAYSSEMRDVYNRRRPWYTHCSNYSYYSIHSHAPTGLTTLMPCRSLPVYGAETLLDRVVVMPFDKLLRVETSDVARWG